MYVYFVSLLPQFSFILLCNLYIIYMYIIYYIIIIYNGIAINCPDCMYRDQDVANCVHSM